MRILIVSDTTGHMRGGVPAATRQLIEGLVSRGHEIGFCSDIALSAHPSVRFFPAEIFEPKILAKRVFDAIEHFRPEVVHLISMSSKGLLATIPGLRGWRWVLTCHSIPPYERKISCFHGSETLHYSFRWLRFLANTLAWRYLFFRGEIPAVIAHSEWVRRIARRYGHPDARTTVIPLGDKASPTASASPLRLADPDAPVLLTVGGVAHTKGQHDAIVAVAKLRVAFPNIQYRIVGEIRDASYLRWLTGLIERHGLGGNVRILESLNEPDKQRIVDSADLYLQPSHEEGFCLAFLEAAHCVARLVATDAGAMRRICGNDAAARVVPVRDPAAIADAVASLLAADVADDVLPERRLRLTREFGWESYTEAHVGLYSRLRGVAAAPLPGA